MKGDKGTCMSEKEGLSRVSEIIHEFPFVFVHACIFSCVLLFSSLCLCALFFFFISSCCQLRFVVEKRDKESD